MNSQGGEGENKRLSIGTGHLRRSVIRTGISQGELFVLPGSNAERVGAAFVDCLENNEKRSVPIQIQFPEILPDTIGNVQIQILHHFFHQGGGFQDVTFVDQVGGAGVDPKLGHDTFRRSVFARLGIAHHHTGCLLIDVALSAGQIVRRTCAQQGGNNHGIPVPTQNRQDNVEGE